MVNKQEPATQERLKNRFVSKLNRESVAEIRHVFTGIFLTAFTCRKVLATKARQVCVFFQSEKEHQSDDAKKTRIESISIATTPILLGETPRNQF